MTEGERILHRAFTEPLPEPEEIPALLPGYWRVEGVARAVLEHVKRLAP